MVQSFRSVQGSGCGEDYWIFTISSEGHLKEKKKTLSQSKNHDKKSCQPARAKDSVAQIRVRPSQGVNNTTSHRAIATQSELTWTTIAKAQRNATNNRLKAKLSIAPSDTSSFGILIRFFRIILLRNNKNISANKEQHVLFQKQVKAEYIYISSTSSWFKVILF